MSSLPPYARLGVVVALVALVLGGGIYLLFLRGGDDGSVLDTLAPVLGARQRARGSGPDP